MTRTLLSALLAAVSLATIAPAGAVVPGSDTYQRAAETAAIQSVIAGKGPRVTSEITETRAFGYPASNTVGELVPGSDTFRDAADARDLHGIATSAPAAAFQAAPFEAGDRLVPGSDRY